MDLRDATRELYLDAMGRTEILEDCLLRLEKAMNDRALASLNASTKADKKAAERWMQATPSEHDLELIGLLGQLSQYCAKSLVGELRIRANRGAVTDHLQAIVNEMLTQDGYIRNVPVGMRIDWGRRLKAIEAKVLCGAKYPYEEEADTKEDTDARTDQPTD